jgi:Mg2+-importing ATPase
LSSVFDYLTFGLLLLIMHAKEKEFQTGWFVESVVSAILIVLVVRTRLSFLKSLPGKYLAIATAAVFVVVIAIPFTSMARWFGFTQLPFQYYGMMVLIVAAYLFSAEFAKRLFYRKMLNKIKLFK